MIVDKGASWQLCRSLMNKLRKPILERVWAFLRLSSPFLGAQKKKALSFRIGLEHAIADDLGSRHQQLYAKISGGSSDSLLS